MSIGSPNQIPRPSTTQDAESTPAGLIEEIRAWKKAGLERQLAEPQGLDFTSNDYLGLSRHPAVVQAAASALMRYGAGAPAARLLRGELAPHRQAEMAAAQWQKQEAALLFPSGWQANQALISTFAGPEDVIFSDALNHASIIDGCRLSRAEVEVFGHRSLEDLEAALKRHPDARRRWIVTESVFSMDGDRAPLALYGEMARRYDAWLWVDEAHASGLFGPEGQGLCAVEKPQRLWAQTITGGKALGVSGAFVVGSSLMRKWLLNRGRAFVFTTAAPPATAAALQASMAVLQQEPERGHRARQNALELHRLLLAQGWRLPAPEAAIVPVPMADEETALATASRLQRDGFDVRAVRPPTVPRGSCRLRLVCHADHRPEQLQALSRALSKLPSESNSSLRLAIGKDGENRPPAPRGLLVAGTDTGVGKTVVSALLYWAANQKGLPAQYWKPIQTGSDSDTDTVADLLQGQASKFPSPAFAFPLPASIDQAAEQAGERVELSALTALAKQNLSPDRFWIAEGAGGLRVPLNDHEDQLDFFAALRLPVVLVARSGLGTLNHTLLSVEALQSHGLPLRALFLVGTPHEANEKSLRRRLPLPIFRLPQLPDLNPQSFADWAGKNDCSPLWT
ncbi:MAG: dethiobiotin synthase [Planctomycetota bacterium]|nr:MAG: dethiobiotin synthase [Planctomycetota bacterium]